MRIIYNINIILRIGESKAVRQVDNEHFAAKFVCEANL